MEVPNRSAGEQEFINQMTRKKLVDWCYDAIHGGSFSVVMQDRHYLEYAKLKKWVSADGSRILSPGWETAARFLKR